MNTSLSGVKYAPVHPRAKRRILTAIVTAFFAVLCAIIVFPLLAGFLASLCPGRDLLQNGLALNLDFSTMSLSNYAYLFSGAVESVKYFTWYKNSLILTVEMVTCVLLACYFVAYGLSMYDFKLQSLLFFLVISIMCVPFEILMLPLYREVGQLGLSDSNLGVLLPRVCSASTIFFFRQYMRSLPKDLLDSGRIDGCTEFGISVRIMMPLTKPAFASMAIMCAMNTWNDMLWPMLIFRDSQKFTLQIGLNTLLTPYGNNYDVLIAGAMFGILPILVVFLLFQRYLIEGLTAGAVKG